jgi:hypothetical protein
MVSRLRRPRFPSSFVGFFDGAVQPHLDQELLGTLRAYGILSQNQMIRSKYRAD